MKNRIADLGDVIIAAGFILFVLRGFISTVSPDEPFARDLFGFPLLEPGYFDVPGDILLQFFIGGAIPFVLIGFGYWLRKQKN
jgi:hypothetical protein